ncbi:EAL domain-containing protein [Dyella sp. A6]|uniref:bifunctional diguanylate cyclase/phosphodiesterase n=1 Tax=Dyella aluminiiresistens TaxID=3069105 RepID=UPI002E797383|nr:EAL domain-containing protein [Dyella sp. A6]
MSSTYTVRRYARIMLAQGMFFLLSLGLIWWSRYAAGVAVAWFANSFLLGLLLRGWLQSVPWTLAGGFVASLIAGLIMEMPLATAMGFSLANMVEIATALLLVQRLKLSFSDQAMGRMFVLGMTATTLIAPAAGALIGATVIAHSFGISWAAVYRDWWLGDAAGMIFMLPPLVTFSPTQLWALLTGDQATSFWPSLLISLLITVVAVQYLRRPFVVLSIPLLVAAYRLNRFGTTLVCSANIAAVFVIATGDVTGWWKSPRGLHALHADELAFFTSASVLGPLLIGHIAAQRRRVTRSLAEVSTRLRVVTDNVPALIAQLDEQARYTFVNRKYTEWNKLSESDVIGHTPLEVFGAATATKMMPYIQRALAGERQLFEIGMPSGRRFEVRYEPQYENDDVTGFYMLAQDISARRELESRLREITDNVPAAIAYLDEGLVYRYANEQYAALWKRDVQSIVGHSSREIAGEKYSAQLHPMQVSTLGGEPTHGELHLEDGRTYEISYVPHIVQGEVRGIYKLAVNVTEHKRMEEDLFEAYNRLERMLDSIGDAVISCDRTLRITMMNPVAVKMTGWTEQDAIGQPFDTVVRLVDTESGKPSLNPLKVAIRENRVVGLQTDSALLQRDGTPVPVEDSASPVHDSDGRIVGGIMVFHDVSEARAMAMKMSHLAQHDYLTELPNRILFEDRLSRALESMQPENVGAVMFVDLDHFKHINDSLGHPAGDQVLKTVSERLRLAVRPDDTVSRQGGDEFVILLNQLADPRDAARVAERIIQSLESGVELNGQKLHLSASIGISMFPLDSNDSKSLLKQADTALYHAKQAGRGRFSYFTESMSEKAEQRLALEHALRQAIHNGELFVLYQPKVRWPDGAVVGAEALVRWRRSNGNVLTPDSFIPLAEETTLVNQIDEWVMHEACRQSRAWQMDGLPALPVSVNLSLAHLDAERVLNAVRSALAEENAPPGCLQIEFTESQMFTHKDRARELLIELKALGVGLVIDDFGTGYSSLNYLSRYNFDIIKIDRSFVSGIPSNHKQYAIVQAIVGMARALGYQMVAEGVETLEEASTLARHGCSEMQGFLFSAAVSPDVFASMARTGIVTHTAQVTPDHR